MANFKPDMSWRDNERVQRVTEQPSGGAHERAAETPDVRVNMRPNGQATEQSAGQAQQTPGRSTSRIPRPAGQRMDRQLSVLMKPSLAWAAFAPW